MRAIKMPLCVLLSYLVEGRSTEEYDKLRAHAIKRYDRMQRRDCAIRNCTIS